MALPEIVTALHVSQSGQWEVLWFNAAVGAGHCEQVGPAAPCDCQAGISVVRRQILANGYVPVSSSYSINKYHSTTFLRFHLLENAQRDRV